MDDYEGDGPHASSCITPLPGGLSSGECPEAGRAAHGGGERAPTGRSDKVGHRVFPHPIRPGVNQGPTPEHSGVLVHDIGADRNKHPPGYLYLGGHCNGRSCRIVPVAAAQEDLDDLVDDEQYEGQAEAEQPLVTTE